ncbi:MAG: nitrile hydratase subunit beta [Methyloligellaceae bacterium]
MDGIHDLGGRQGFGKVDVEEAEEAFHSDWEARAYAIIRAMRKAPDWRIDKFRFTREQIDPADYLTRPYYDQWLQSYAAMMVGSGVASVEEIASGHAQTGPADLGPPPGPDRVAHERTKPRATFERPYDKPFRFAVGDAVRTKSHAHGGHTRLPGYARGRTGTVAYLRGAFMLPDDSARGIERAEPLYTVAFKASEFWPDEGREHLIHLDLWESYLEPA